MTFVCTGLSGVAPFDDRLISEGLWSQLGGSKLHGIEIGSNARRVYRVARCLSHELGANHHSCIDAVMLLGLARVRVPLG